MEFYEEETTLSWAARHPHSDEIMSQMNEMGVVIWGDWIASQDIFKEGYNLDFASMKQMASKEIEWFDCSLNADNEIQLPVDWERDNTEIFELDASQLNAPSQEVIDTFAALLTEKDAYVMGETIMIRSYVKEITPFFYDYQQNFMWEWEEQHLGGDE